MAVETRRQRPWPADAGWIDFPPGEIRDSYSGASRARDWARARVAKSRRPGQVPKPGHPFVVGGLYEDCSFHPCLCIKIDEDERDLMGISLLDGSLPRSCSIDHCGPEVVTVDEAVLIRVNFDAFKERRVAGSSVQEALDGLVGPDHR